VDSLFMPASENLHNCRRKPALSQSTLCASSCHIRHWPTRFD
jgi:hypothetical protein